MATLEEKIASVSDSVLHHRINNRLILIIALFILFVGGLVWKNSVDNAAHNAEVQQLMKANKADQDRLVSDLKDSFKQQVEIAKQQKVIEHTIEVRDKAADKDKAAVTAPDRTIDQTASDVKAFLHMNVKVVAPDNLFGFSQPDTQKIITFKIDRDRFEDNLKDKTAQLVLEKQNTDLLTVNVDKLKQQVSKDSGIIEQLNNEKNPSKVKEYIKIGVGVLVGAGLHAILHK